MRFRSVERSRRSLAYVLLVTLAGTGALAHSVAALSLSTVSPLWIALAALTLVSGRFPIRIPGVPASYSVSEVFAFVMVLLFGPASATVVLGLDGLLLSLAQRQRSFSRVAFNTAEAALSIWLAGWSFYLIAARPPLLVAPAGAGELLLPVSAMALVYLGTNSALSLGAILLETGRLPRTLAHAILAQLSVECLSSASLAALAVQGATHVDLNRFAFVVPPLAAVYLTVQLFAARLADARQHLKDVQRLYRSTVECLAVAIDAKDQVTHGHIRRVQRFALALAHALGVTDEQELKALEVAAVLHDVGKLAVPDYILNKPGPLTPAEYERMKRHARAGAEILAAAGFPYPVAPVVRHHHENWDGTGYPDGLKGTAIPRAARILAVVDCFDALTSDRPYRPRLSTAEALEVLRSRRGTMYDPEILDTFIEILPGLLGTPDEVAPSQRAARAVTEPERVGPPVPAVA